MERKRPLAEFMVLPWQRIGSTFRITDVSSPEERRNLASRINDDGRSALPRFFVPLLLGPRRRCVVCSPRRRSAKLQPAQELERQRNAIRQDRGRLLNTYHARRDPGLDRYRLDQHALGQLMAERVDLRIKGCKSIRDPRATFPGQLSRFAMHHRWVLLLLRRPCRQCFRR